MMATAALVLMTALRAERAVGRIDAETEALVIRLYNQEARSLVRLARLFVDNRDAAEDVVQEAFVRLARAAHRIEAPDRAAAYLRSIVLNLARDSNRRGLMSLRHTAAAGREVDLDPFNIDDKLVTDERQQDVLDAVRDLPRRQRDCIVLRYYEQQSIERISTTLGVSPNSVKTHLKRALVTLSARLEGDR